MVTANAAASLAAATSSTAGASVVVSSVTSVVSSVATVSSVVVVSESLPQAAAKRLKANTAAATRTVDLRNVFPF
jgi:hypothetical protein